MNTRPKTYTHGKNTEESQGSTQQTKHVLGDKKHRETQRTVTHTLPLEARDHDSPFLSIAMQPLKSYPAPLTLVTSTVYGGTKNTLLAKKHKVDPDDFIRSFLAPNFD